MIDYSELDVYFHRLAPSTPTDDALNAFYEDGYVLCHYEDKASFSSEDYDDGAADLEDMVEAAESGSLCLVQLNADNDHYEGNRKLGAVQPGTDPFVVGVDENGNRTDHYTDPEVAKKELEGGGGVQHIYKGVQLEDQQTLYPGKYLLSAYEPPSTTFCRWGVVEDQIEALFHGEQLPPDEPTSYSPDQIERLCEEFLREEYDYYPLIKPGGAAGLNQDIDLVGGSYDRNVFGEVKNTQGTSDSALRALEAVSDEETLAFYFSRNSVEEPPDDVEIVLLEDVLETLDGIDRTRQMMEQMTAC